MSYAAKLRAPGWYRLLISTPIGFALGFGIVVAVRALYGWHPLIDGNAITTVEPDHAPARLPDRHRLLRLLVPLGRGRADHPRGPLRPRRHSWQDYFRVNTDHKVIGLQYICTTFFFFVAGGLMAMLMRAELAAPGTQFVGPEHLQRPVLGARLADDLPVHHPGLRRASRTTCCR